MTRIEFFRNFYSQFIVAAAGLRGEERLVSAFRIVPRENFVGEGPWSAFTPTGYISTQTNDPAVLYQDILVKLPGVEGSINNGQPSLHAACLAAISPETGETGIHIGAGTGYYTAILAELVGAKGSINAFEIEASLAGRATRNLAPWPRVKVRCDSGSNDRLPRADFIYVSAGATHPDESWLAAVSANGRILFPLTPSEGGGGMLLLSRVSGDAFNARFVCPAAFIPCVGVRDDALGSALTEAFRFGSIFSATSLRLGSRPDDSCCFAGGSWWLSTRPV